MNGIILRKKPFFGCSKLNWFKRHSHLTQAAIKSKTYSNKCCFSKSPYQKTAFQLQCHQIVTTFNYICLKSFLVCHSLVLLKTGLLRFAQCSIKLVDFCCKLHANCWSDWHTKLENCPISNCVCGKFLFNFDQENVNYSI